MTILSVLALFATIYHPLGLMGGCGTEDCPKAGGARPHEATCWGGNVLFSPFEKLNWREKLSKTLGVDDLAHVPEFALVGIEDGFYDRRTEVIGGAWFTKPLPPDPELSKFQYILLHQAGVARLRVDGVVVAASFDWPNLNAIWDNELALYAQAPGTLSAANVDGNVVSTVAGDTPAECALGGYVIAFDAAERVTWNVHPLAFGPCRNDFCFESIGDGEVNRYRYRRDGVTHETTARLYGGIGAGDMDDYEGFEVEFAPSGRRFLLLSYAAQPNDDTFMGEYALFQVSPRFEKLGHTVRVDP